MFPDSRRAEVIALFFVRFFPCMPLNTVSSILDGISDTHNSKIADISFI